MASNEARAHFTLAGYSFNPEEITQTLGVEPTSVNGSGANSTLQKPAISTWTVSSENFIDDIDVFTMTSDLIKILEPVKEEIKDLIKRYNLVPKITLALLLSVDKDEISPEVGFGSRAIKFLSDIGAFVEVDYKLSKRI